MATTLGDSKNGIPLPSFNSTIASDNSASSANKSSLDYEQNPFEQSFAPGSVSNNSSSVNNVTSPLITPGGRKLPPLVLSPNVPSSWSTSGFPRTGLTPNGANLRTGLTPAGSSFTSSLGGIQIHGINTPGSLAFPNFSSGLNSLLGTGSEQNIHNVQKQINGNSLSDLNSNVGTGASSVKQSPPQASNKVSEPVPKSTTEIEPSNNPTNKSVKKTTKKRIKKETLESRSKKVKLSENSSQLKKSAKRNKDEYLNEKDNEDESNENVTEDEKRKQFLERNRVAASKCRQRKKEQSIKMENDLNFYLNEYNNLTAAIDQLKDLSMILRSQIINTKSTTEMVNSVDNILQTINHTNYVSRMRGNNPSNIIPTVQPINPVLVQQNQQFAALNAAAAAAAAEAAEAAVIGGNIGVQPAGLPSAQQPGIGGSNHGIGVIHDASGLIVPPQIEGSSSTVGN